MTILITGSKGQLGSELQEIICHSREGGNLAGSPTESGMTTRVLFVDRDELDITDSAAVEEFFFEKKPDYCINAAAYTNVEKAEEEKDAAYAVNVTGAQNIAAACTKNNTILLHISTDFVFDGKKTVPYMEDDEPHPLGVYGMTKYQGELAVQEYCKKSFIVRTSWLYSSFGSNFVKTIQRLCKERDALPVVADHYGSPTYARDLAEALVRMIEYCERKKIVIPSETKNPTGSLTGVRDDIPFGTYHYTNEGEVTWFEFAQKIVELSGLSCVLQPIPASDFPSRVTRPAYSALSTKKIQATFGIAIPDWDTSVESCWLRME